LLLLLLYNFTHNKCSGGGKALEPHKNAIQNGATVRVQKTAAERERGAAAGKNAPRAQCKTPRERREKIAAKKRAFTSSVLKTLSCPLREFADESKSSGKFKYQLKVKDTAIYCEWVLQFYFITLKITEICFGLLSD